MADEELNDADAPQVDENTASDDEQDSQPEQGGSKKKLILIVIPVIILLLGAVGLHFSGILSGGEDVKVEESADADAPAEGEEKTEDKADIKAEGEATEGTEGEAAVPEIAPKNVYFDLPDILVNLNSGNKKQIYLKVLITLSLPDAETATIVENEMPRILDSFQVYLRELTVDEIQASAGMYRLKEELVGRINKVISPARINDVLFKEMLIQ